MAAALVTGDPCGSIVFSDALDDECRLRELKTVCKTRHHFKGNGNSDLISRVNMYVHSVGQESGVLVTAGIAEQQANIFRYEFEHLAERVMAYIKKHCPHLLPLCAVLDRVRDRMMKQLPLETLTTDQPAELLQVLAGAPCLICGHEVQQRLPQSCKMDTSPEQGDLVYLANVIKNKKPHPQADVVTKLVGGWLGSLDMPEPDLKPQNENLCVVWLPTCRADAGMTIQVLNQWAKQQMFEVITD